MGDFLNPIEGRATESILYQDMGDNSHAERVAGVAGARAIVLRASAAQGVGTVIGATVTGQAGHRRIIAVLDITASATDSTDTLDVYLDCSFDGVRWYNSAHFATQPGDGGAKTRLVVIDPTAGSWENDIDVTADAAAGVTRPAVWGPYLRVRSTVVEAGAGGAASHTFSVVAFGQS